MNGIYYDGISFDRLAMRRVRKVLNAASAGLGYTPGLIDIHTGEEAQSPSSVRYLAHFAYADRAWNGEGFNWDAAPAYYLIDVSGLMHGIGVDRLGGEADFKGMTFGSTQRNTDVASALWNLWDDVDIQGMEMIGWWDKDVPVKVVLPPTPGQNESCPTVMNMSHVTGRFPIGCHDGPNNVVAAFGSDCGPVRATYPYLTRAEAVATCCQLGADCQGFSFKANSSDPTTGAACMKKAVDCG